MPDRRIETGGPRALLAVIAGLLSAPALGIDVLVLASGERRPGLLKSCSDERCFVDAASIPLENVVWIGLAVSESQLPAGTSAPGAVHLDGGVTAGRLVGISQGAVVLESAELERSAVRWVRLTAGQPPVDVLIRRAGGVSTGGLQGCAGETCTLAGQATARRDLIWIGLGAEPGRTAPPPRPGDGSRDAIQRINGSMTSTPLVGISATEVVVGSGRHPRGEVAWIYLAPPAQEPGGPVSNPSAHPPGAPPTQPPGSSSPPPEPGPAPQPPPSPRTVEPGRGTRGGLWTGTIHGRAVSGTPPGNVHVWTCQAEAKLREWSSPLFAGAGSTRRVGRMVRLTPEGTVMFNRTSCSGQYIASCGGEGSVTLSYGPEVPQPSVIYLKDEDVDMTPGLGFDVPRHGGLYVIGLATENSATFRWTITNTDGGSDTHDHGYGCFLQGRSPLLDENMDPQIRSLDGGRMVGSYSTTWNDGQLDVSWSLCREGSVCPPPEPLPPPAAGGDPPTDCDETRVDRALLDVKMDQLRNLLQSLKRIREEYLSLTAQAAQWKGDYEFAMRQCNLWNAARFLVGLLATGGATSAELEGHEAVKQFWNLLSMAEKVENGDPSWMVPNHEFDGAFELSLEDAWDGFVIGYGQLGPSSPELLRDGLLDCAVANIDAVMDGARKYLDLVEQVKPLAERMNRTVNDVVDKDEQIFDFCLSHPKACEDYERCR